MAGGVGKARGTGDSPSPSRLLQRGARIRPASLAFPVLALLLACLTVYANSLSAPVVFDDRVTLFENPQLREWWNPAVVLFPARELPVAGRPLVNLSFALNYAAGGFAVEGYHLVNLLLHVACALLFGMVVLRTLLLPRLTAWQPMAAPIAWGAALVWAVHPINSEAVNYLSQRSESLMAVALLTTLYASIRARHASRRGTWHSVAVTSCLAGMACKETMIVAPLLVWLHDWTFARPDHSEPYHEGHARPRRDGRWARWPLYAALASTTLLLGALQWTRPRSFSAGFTSGVDTWTYLLNQAPLLIRYGRLMVWPMDLVANYGAPVPLSLGQVLPHVAAIVAGLIATVLALLRWPAVGFLFAWVFITLAPTSSIVPIATEVGAERRMYLPSMALVVAFVVLVAFLLERLRRSPSIAAASATDPAWRARTVTVTCALLAIPLGTITHSRNREYASALTLAQTSASRWPSPTATLMLGTELAAAGQHAEALPYLRAAAEHLPRARYNLGVELFSVGDLDGAAQQLRRFVEEHSTLIEVLPARALIGRVYAAREQWPAAIAEFDAVVAMAPGNTEGRELLASALGNQGAALAMENRLQEAVTTFRRASNVTPNVPVVHRNLAAALLEAHDLTGARQSAQRALQLAPGDAEVHNLLGRILAISGDRQGAEPHLARAVALSPGNEQAAEDLRRLRETR